MVNLSFFLVFPFLSHQSWTPGMSVRSRRSATVTARGEKGGRWRDGGVKNRRHGAQLLGRGGCHASATQQTNGWQLINGDTMEIRKISQTHIINYVYIYVYMYVYIYIYNKNYNSMHIRHIIKRSGSPLYIYSRVYTEVWGWHIFSLKSESPYVFL
jgi:hypothetical protein